MITATSFIFIHIHNVKSWPLILLRQACTSCPHHAPILTLSQTTPIPVHPETPNRYQREEKIRILYEEYISLHHVMHVWENPITVKPDLEPVFSAAMHGVELAFVLMSEFISDARHYVVKRPRVELIANDLQTQIELVRNWRDSTCR